MREGGGTEINSKNNFLRSLSFIDINNTPARLPPKLQHLTSPFVLPLLAHLYWPRTNEKTKKNKRKHKFEGIKQPHAISGGMMLMFMEEEEAQKKKIEIEK